MALINGVQAAKRAGTDRHRFAAWVKAGVIPVFVDPISGRKRYSEESIDRWLESFQPLPKDGAA